MFLIHRENRSAQERVFDSQPNLVYEYKRPAIWIRGDQESHAQCVQSKTHVLDWYWDSRCGECVLIQWSQYGSLTVENYVQSNRYCVNGPISCDDSNHGLGYLRESFDRSEREPGCKVPNSNAFNAGSDNDS